MSSGITLRLIGRKSDKEAVGETDLYYGLSSEDLAHALTKGLTKFPILLYSRPISARGVAEREVRLKGGVPILLKVNLPPETRIEKLSGYTYLSRTSIKPEHLEVVFNG